MKPLPPKLSVRNIVAATLVTATTLVLGTFGALDYVTRSRDEWSRLRRVTSAQTTEIAVALAAPVWSIDRPQIEKILDSQAEVTWIEGIIVDAAGQTHTRVRDAQRRFVTAKGAFPTEGLFMQERPITFNGERIGTVRLFTTPALIQEQLRNVLMRMVIAILVTDLLLIFLVYFILWRAVLQPLTEIERYAGAVSAEERPDEPSLGPAPTAELESLRVSIETMVREVELREQRFRSIFESVNDAIFIFDAESGAILDVNARTCEMFGYTREEMKHVTAGMLSSGAPPYTQEDALVRIRGAVSGDQQLFEWQARHRDGHLFWIEVNIQAAKIGGVRCVVSVVRDVTERRRMEEALRHGETMSMMGSIVAGVAHEVRNPLFGIAAALDAFEAEFSRSPDVDEYMAALRSDVSRLNRLMHDLLDYGRPPQFVRHSQSIRPVIAEAVRICAPRAREKQIEIREQIAGDVPDVAIDSDRMLQVLKNVVENAIAFSAEGSAVTIAVRAEQDASPASTIVTIADRGPGFSREDLPHLFEPFFTRRAGGSGLGLAIAQKIVTEHGGTIAARNADGGGGMIEIAIPASTLREPLLD